MTANKKLEQVHKELFNNPMMCGSKPLPEHDQVLEEWYGKQSTAGCWFSLVGSGHSRSAYISTKEPWIVLKVATKAHVEANMYELVNYRSASDKVKALLAPCFHDYNDNQILEMALCRPYNEMTDGVVTRMHNFIGYYADRNLGWLQLDNDVEKLVYLDYGELTYEDEIKKVIPRINDIRIVPSAESIRHVLHVGDCRQISTKKRCNEMGNILPKRSLKEVYALVEENANFVFEV